VKDLDLSGNNFEILHACIKECPSLRNLKLDGCKRIEEIKGLPWKLESLSAKQCTSLKYLDFTGECPSSIRTLILDGCSLLYEVKGVLPNLDSFSAKKCTSLNNQSRSMIMNQVPLLFLFNLEEYLLLIILIFFIQKMSAFKF
jgi:hypothetical protein